MNSQIGTVMGPILELPQLCSTDGFNGWGVQPEENTIGR